MIPYPKTFSFICLLVLSVIVFATCTDNIAIATDPRGSSYAGSNACVSCHNYVFTSYTHNSHYKTSSTINYASLEKIVPFNNAFYFQDSSYIHIERKADSFYQTYFSDGKRYLSNQYDMAFGSGEKAQTYASWQQGKLLQLPLSYFAGMKSWANSPGFTMMHAKFGRVIESRCFECHASYIGKEMVQSGPVAVSEKLDRNAIIYGIDCERCHGPAADHVIFQQNNPSVKTAKFITTIKSLSRQQQLDLCASCHSGNDQTTQRSLFAFRPGDTLSHFYYPEFEANDREPDVHGKQMQLLQMSLCFQKTNMTCSTCHNAHEAENDQITNFVFKCMNCHQKSVHAVTNMKEMQQQGGNASKLNCIDCHMPSQPSKTIYFNTSTGVKNIPYFLRTHRIAVYK